MKTGSVQSGPLALYYHRLNIPQLRLHGVLVLFAAAFLAVTAAPAFSRQPSHPQASPGNMTQTVKCLIGLEKIKPNTRGALSLEPAGLKFATEHENVDISTKSIQDIFTGQESRQDLSGMQGAMVKAAIPYQGGRFVSLFSHKVEVLTVEYTDPNGGLHGAIFVLGEGKATMFKNQLVAQGARVGKHIEPAEPKEEKP